MKQAVVRTGLLPRGNSYNSNSYRFLEQYLNEGYFVIMCHSIGDELEYILQKE